MRADKSIDEWVAVDGAPDFAPGVIPSFYASLQENLEVHFYWMLRNWGTYEDRLLRVSTGVRWKIVDDERCLPMDILIAVQERFYCAPPPDALLEALRIWVRADGYITGFDGVIFEVISDAWENATRKVRMKISPCEILEKVEALANIAAFLPDDARRLLVRYGNPDGSNYLFKCVVWLRGFDDLFRTNPQMAILWLTRVDNIDFKSVDAILEAELQISRGARNLLADLGLPTERRVLKILRKIPLSDLKITSSILATDLEEAAKTQNFWQWMQPVPLLPMALLSLIKRFGVIPSTDIMSEVALEHQQSGGNGNPCLPVMDLLSDTLRMLAATGECRRVQHLGGVEHLRQVHDRLAEDFGNDPSKVPLSFNFKAFPVTPPIKPEKRIIALRTVQEIIGAGRDFHNCCRYYIRDVSQGRYFIYTILMGEERAMLGLARDACGNWVVQQLYGPRNSPVSRRIERLVDEWLKRSKKVAA